MSNKIKRLSNQYRISHFCFEGERGFLSKMNTPQAGVYIAGVQKLIDNGLINEDMLK